MKKNEFPVNKKSRYNGWKNVKVPVLPGTKIYRICIKSNDRQLAGSPCANCAYGMCGLRQCIDIFPVSAFDGKRRYDCLSHAITADWYIMNAIIKYWKKYFFATEDDARAAVKEIEKIPLEK